MGLELKANCGIRIAFEAPARVGLLLNPGASPPRGSQPVEVLVVFLNPLKHSLFTWEKP